MIELIIHCQLCKSPLNLLKGQLNLICNRCKRHVCWKCNHSIPIILVKNREQSMQKQRVCIFCNSQHIIINKIVKEKKIKWGEDSVFSEEWTTGMRAATMNKNGSTVSKNFEYQHFLQLFQTNMKSQSYYKQMELIDKLVASSEKKVNNNFYYYSLNQFICIIQNSFQKQEMKTIITNIFYALSARYDGIECLLTIGPICTYLLCLCSQQSAYIICCDIIENILPQNFIVRNKFGLNWVGFKADSYFLKEYFSYILTTVKLPLISHRRKPYTKDQIQHIIMITQVSISKIMFSMFTNFLPFLHLQFIWDELSLKRDFQVVQRIILTVLYLKRQQLLQLQSIVNIQQVLADIEIGELIQTYYDLDIDAQMKTKLFLQFYELQIKKKPKNIEHHINQLLINTNFTKEEVKLLHQIFGKKEKEYYIKGVGVINKSDFVLLTNSYYIILKQNYETEAPILQVTSDISSNIFDSFASNSKITSSLSNTFLLCLEKKLQKQVNKEEYNDSQINSNLSSMLDFQQFIYCFSLCTKSLLKEKICSIMNTYKDNNRKISFYNFQKTIKKLCQNCPANIETKKQAFFQRINIYFSQQQGGVTPQDLTILLNDQFINQLNLYIRSDAPNIMKKTIDKFYSIKNRNQSTISNSSNFYKQGKSN